MPNYQVNEPNVQGLRGIKKNLGNLQGKKVVEEDDDFDWQANEGVFTPLSNLNQFEFVVGNQLLTLEKMSNLIKF